MEDMQLSALLAGTLSSAFYYIYAALQIPVGVLYDRKNTRFITVSALFILSFGCFLFSQSYLLSWLFVARILMGFGSAFAFVGLSHLLRMYFPLRQFGFMIGFSETLALIVSVVGVIGFGMLVQKMGWRPFVFCTSLFGLVLALLSMRFIPSIKPSYGTYEKSTLLRDLRDIVLRPKLWITGIFAGLSFSVITVFASMWAVPFFQVKLNLTLQETSVLIAFLYIGAAVGCPLFGFLMERFQKRCLLMMTACVCSAFILLILILFPISRFGVACFLMGILGLFSGIYMLAYSIANELSPPHARSTCTGFINTLAILVAPLFQPFIGYVLDVSASYHAHTAYELQDYQNALTMMPVFLLIAGLLSFFLVSSVDGE